MDESVFSNARDFVAGLFEGDSSGHDIWHTVRVHDLAVTICRAETQERIVRVISQISFKGTDSVVPDTLEGRIVQDADRMDAIGAIGVARAFAYGGSRGRPMHIPGEGPKLGMDDEAYRSNEGTTVNHFHEKLLLLRDMMNTDTARRMAQARHDYMVGFLEEFAAEWDGLR